MRSAIVSLAVFVALGLAIGLVGGQPPATTTSVPVAKDQSQAVRQSVADYCAAFNKGDVQGISSFWTADAEYSSDSGKTYKGQAEIVGLFRKFLADNPGAKMNLQVKNLRFLRSDVAMGDGESEVTTADGTVDKGRFTAAWVKADGKWLLTSARDLPSEGENVSPIAGMNWMIGEWQSEGKPVIMTCKPVLNKAYTQMDFSIKRPDGDMSITYLFGYDPLTESVKSWTFDSAGGYGEALWTRDGNQWTGRAAGVLPDGQTGSTNFVIKYIDDNTFELQMRERQVGGQPLGDSDTKYTRKAKK